MTAERVTSEMVDQLQESLTLTRATPAQLRQRADTEYAWASEADAYELEPGLERSYVLSVAADDYLAAGDRERALAVAREAQAAEAPGGWDGCISLIRAQLGLGDVEAAKAAADEARKAAASDPMLAEMVGDAFELADQLALAERWYSIGLRGIELGDEWLWHERLLRDRYRVRRDQSKPLDAMDEEFEALSEG